MKQYEYFKIKSWINGVWNSKLFREDYTHGAMGATLPVIHKVNDVRFMKEIAIDPKLSSEIIPEQTLAGKTKLLIKVVIEL